MSDPVCVTCSGPIVFDNNDGDIQDGRFIGYRGSSEASFCTACCEWFHNHHGNEKNRICTPCIERCEREGIDWRIEEAV